MKPTSLMIKDGKENIIKTINETELPPCVIKLIIKDIMNEIEKLCYQEEKRDLEEYTKSLESTKKETLEKGEK